MVNFTHVNQLDKEGKVVDKIITITRQRPHIETFSLTQLEKKKAELEEKRDRLSVEIAEIDLVIGGVNNG